MRRLGCEMDLFAFSVVASFNMQIKQSCWAHGFCEPCKSLGLEQNWHKTLKRQRLTEGQKTFKILFENTHCMFDCVFSAQSTEPSVTLLYITTVSLSKATIIHCGAPLGNITICTNVMPRRTFFSPLQELNFFPTSSLATSVHHSLCVSPLAGWGTRWVAGFLT